MEPLLVSVAEGARIAGTGRGHAYELAQSGEWASIRRGRRILVVRRSIEDWAERIAEEATKEPDATEESQS